MNRDSNSYTFLFAGIMVLIVASTLAFTSSSLKEKQQENVRKEQMQNILSTIGISVSRDEAENLYKKFIKEEISLKIDGTADTNVNAFKISLKTEIKKPKQDCVILCPIRGILNCESQPLNLGYSSISPYSDSCEIHAREDSTILITDRFCGLN